MTASPGPARRAAALLGALLLGGASAAGVAACGPEGPRPLRAFSQSYEFRVSADPSPPRASEPTKYTVVVVDRATRKVIDRGEGQIYATSQDRANIFDSFEPAPEAGTYTARLTYITAGDWHVALRFRRDSAARIEKVDDWVQTVRGARPINERPIQ